MFAPFPGVIPIASGTAGSWGKPGLSPYESYFNKFSEYVSTGNGLLTVEMGTLNLPGRNGLDLDPTLVYSAPYAFEGSSAFQYDNYTLGNLGLGWSFNFPWLGMYYLHLTDGQAYPYQWGSGTSYEYHEATNYKITRNGDGTYSLLMSSGLLYTFDSAKRLASITDRTGNNTISFAYGSYGVTTITDTIGRTVTISYNADHQISTIAFSTGSWTLGYTGGQLTTVQDPLGRTTTFQYSTGINSWLISAILYPTTGKVNYSYAGTAFGTQVSVYYVTGRTVYSSPSQVSESVSTSYSIVNSTVLWSNSTISGGGSPQAYINYNFQSNKGIEKVYYKDSTGTQQRVNETDFDANERLSENKIESPAGTTVLAYSLASYDNWGNVIYTADDIGQQTWFSYANTNSANSFGSSGCTASFFAQTISSNIHDALVGECDFQNGPGSTQQESYYKYDSHANLLEREATHSPSWLYTYYTHDRYGNVMTAKDPLSRITYFRYSSAYGSSPLD